MVSEAVWTNWGGTASCRPAEVEHPASEDEIVAALKRAATGGERVKVAGSGHSFTDIACTGGRMLKLDRYNHVVEVDAANRTVTVEAGITIADLAEELARNGLAFPNLGDIGYQSISGAISTSTHGTGEKLGNLATQVKALRLVLADGSALDLSARSDPESFQAARVSLGALGVISTVTLQCVPAFTLHAVDGPGKLDEVLERFDDDARSNHHYEFYWFPYTDACLVKSNNRTDEAPRPKAKVRAWLEDEFAGNTVFGFVCRVMRARPKWIPRLHRLVGKAITRSEYSDRSDRVFTSPRRVRFAEMEYAIPREAATHAVREVRRVIEENRFDVAFPIECRVSAPDDIFLSTAHGRKTAYVAVHVFQGMQHEPYFRAVEAVMRSLDGRPHWGKMHYQDSRSLREVYPAWGRFAAVRARLDPHGRFRNAYLDRVLGEI
ncbi:MAG: FAD-binding protein [Actinobacteria bacterium]|nr:MAG: FAD-binding protein [Actinomycetota bacterium]